MPRISNSGSWRVYKITDNMYITNWYKITVTLNWTNESGRSAAQNYYLQQLWSTSVARCCFSLCWFVVELSYEPSTTLVHNHDSRWHDSCKEHLSLVMWARTTCLESDHFGRYIIHSLEAALATCRRPPGLGCIPVRRYLQTDDAGCGAAGTRSGVQGRPADYPITHTHTCIQTGLLTHTPQRLPPTSADHRVRLLGSPRKWEVL